MQFFRKITEGLKKTRDAFVERVSDVLRPGKKLEPEDYEALEAALLRADVGPATADRILEDVKRRLDSGADDPAAALREAVRAVVEPKAAPGAAAPRPHVTLVVGVNGTGKTTTIAKLAHRYKEAGDSVLLVACDTFRAAAGDQLEVWAERAGVEMVRQASGADPAAVAFDGMARAKSRNVARAIVDTAGRLHVKANLMAELDKIRRVIERGIPGAPHETLLVLDATVGQNGLQQAKEFGRVLPITGIALTKLDGTAKGGVVLAIADALEIPIRWVGVGEGMDDLVPFDPEEYAAALTGSYSPA
ncbi:MAG TPA: signal recognition particle-docking protein FtsY [Candidatus Eisenbacteria bacterium]|nr:signal recognition particle-docking protein FtsY [Candidatus Eisenbacteria bacterium]